MTAVESRLGVASDGRFEGMFLTQLVGSIIDEYRGDDFFVSACIVR